MPNFPQHQQTFQSPYGDDNAQAQMARLHQAQSEQQVVAAQQQATAQPPVYVPDYGQEASDVMARLTSDHSGSDAVKSSAAILGVAAAWTAWRNRRRQAQAVAAAVPACDVHEGTWQEQYVRQITADIVSSQFLNSGLKVSVVWPGDITTSPAQTFLGCATVREDAGGVAAGSTCDVRLVMDVTAGTCQWQCTEFSAA